MVLDAEPMKVRPHDLLDLSRITQKFVIFGTKLRKMALKTRLFHCRYVPKFTDFSVTLVDIHNEVRETHLVLVQRATL